MPAVTFVGISGHVAGIPAVTFTGMSVTIPESPVTLDRNTQNAQIDIFFSSLAAAMGTRAVGIVFSGYDGDGAEGCQRIKAAGGTTFAQDISAEVSGMPVSARATGSVDFVLPPDKIPAELQKMTTRFRNSSKLKFFPKKAEFSL